MRINRFAGMMPSAGEANSYAALAIDADLSAGTLKPWRTNLSVDARKNNGTLLETRCCILADEQCVDFAMGPPECNGLVFKTKDGVLYQAKESEACKNQWCRVGWPCPMPKPSVSVVNPLDVPPTALTSSVLAYTFVNKYGQRSAPSALSKSFFATAGSQILVSGLPSCPAEYCIEKIEIYVQRSAEVSGGESANTQESGLFKRIEVPCGTNSASFEYGNPGEWLETVGYEPPPKLSNIVSWNDQLAGLSGRHVWFSKRKDVYAWASSSILRPPDFPLRLLVGDSFGYVLTDNKPFVFERGTCQTGDCHRGDVLDGPAIASQKSAAVSGNTLVYAAADGLYMLQGFNRPQRMGSWTMRQWQNLRPDTIVGAIQMGHYYGFHESGGFRVALSGGDLTYLSEKASAVHAGLSGRVLLQEASGITAWNEGESYKKAIWQSHFMRGPMRRYSASRVEGLADRVAIISECDGLIADFGAVASCEVKTVLPSRAASQAFRLETTEEITSAAIAASRADLYI